MSTLEKIEKTVVEGYKNIEEGVVGGYKKIEDTVVGSFNKMADGFVEKHLAKEGETVEEAKERIANETAERTEKAASYADVKTPEVKIPEVKVYDHEEAMKAQKEMIEKNIESAKNAGKR